MKALNSEVKNKLKAFSEEFNVSQIAIMNILLQEALVEDAQSTRELIGLRRPFKNFKTSNLEVTHPQAATLRAIEKVCNNTTLVVPNLRRLYYLLVEARPDYYPYRQSIFYECVDILYVSGLIDVTKLDPIKRKRASCFEITMTRAGDAALTDMFTTNFIKPYPAPRGKKNVSKKVSV